jgi:GT2 family glycosyltransferase/SAM-dependent methyltransferase
METATKGNASSPDYDEHYYSESYGGPVPYERNEYWLGIFHGIADQIVRSLQPRRVLDAGCAKGILVEALWERGVEAYGIDVSAYAISQVRRDMQAFCRCASLTEPIEGRFDLVTCFEVLEHIPKAEERQILANLTAITDTILFSSTPTEMSEPTHVNVRPTIGWLGLFAEFDFAPVLNFDAGFVAPHAILFRRTAQAPGRDVLVLYADLVRYKLTLTDRHNKLAHLQNQVQHLQQDLELSANHIGNLDGQIAANAGAIAQLRQELAGAQKEKELSAQHIRNLNQRIAAEAAEMAQLRQQLADSQRERELSAQHAGNLENLIAAEMAKTAQLRQQLADAESEKEVSAHDIKTLDLQIASGLEEIARVRQRLTEASRDIDKRDAELQTLLQQCTDITDMVSSNAERFSIRLGTMESRIAEVARQNQEILRSRIWRTLCSAGSVLLGAGSLFTGRSPRRRQPAGTPSPASKPAEKQPAHEFFELVCDEPQAGIETPRTGEIVVRGWALADGGLERIEIQLGKAYTFAKTGLSRPDVACGYPDTPEARTAGFLAEIDTRSIPGGYHTLSIRAVSRGGAVRMIQRTIFIDHEKGWASDYDRWIAEFETRNPRLIELKMRTFTASPLISIVMPVYRTPGRVLLQAINSVTAQSYPAWELCIADDGSESAEVEEILARYAQQDPRIKIKFLKTNSGIALCSNAALELASGEFVALLDHDDELAEDALFYVVEALNRQPELDILYSDEDKIDEHGRRYDPFFKPNWSPDLILSENYVAHLLVCRRELVIQAGAFRPGFDGSQDHDLILRLIEKSDRIFHIPRILYHWRAIASSTASVSTQKTYAAAAARRAIEEHLERRALAAKVVPGCFQGRWRVRYPLDSEPGVSLIIASGGKVDILRKNLESVFGKTEYRNLEVVIIDNSKKTEIEKLVTMWPSPARPLRYIDWRDKEFNYAAINNEAARRCSSPLLLFLNDDTSVITSGWLTAMVEMAVRPEVGAVGAKLLYPDGRIQHAGVVMGIFGNCGHAFKGLPGDTHHYFDFPDVIRNVSAVTGACLMTRADVFHEVGGFDEKTFAVAFNDIDLCLKIREKGYRVIYTPHALLYHHEAFSKTAKDLIPDSKEVQAMQTKWRAVIEADPYYNANLSRSAEDYSLARKTKMFHAGA